MTLWTIAYQALLSLEFSRQGYWSGLPFPSPGDLPDPQLEPRSPALQADSLPSKPQESHVKMHAKLLNAVMLRAPVPINFLLECQEEAVRVSKPEVYWSHLLTFPSSARSPTGLWGQGPESVFIEGIPKLMCWWQEKHLTDRWVPEFLHNSSPSCSHPLSCLKPFPVSFYPSSVVWILFWKTLILEFLITPSDQFTYLAILCFFKQSLMSMCHFCHYFKNKCPAPP